jgi:lipid-binding SYLF domain-containing protein
MKRIGIVIGLLMLGVCMVWAQDNNATTSSTTSDNSAAQSGTSNTSDQNTSTISENNSANAYDQDSNADQDQSATQQRKDAAANDANAAESEKDAAKNTSQTGGAEHDKAMARLDDAAKDLNELLSAPDKGIPEDVFKSAKCVAVVPSMIKGGFIFGAEHGRGVASCRLPNGDWSAPAFFVMTGGTWGAQIGVEGIDLTMLFMNDDGANQLLNAKFKIGGALSAAAGPVGRQASADTSWKMNAEILTYSRARGLFAGATLNGTAVKPDEDGMRAYYGRTMGFRPVLTGQVKDLPGSKDLFVTALRHNHNEVNAQAH